MQIDFQTIAAVASIVAVLVQLLKNLPWISERPAWQPFVAIACGIVLMSTWLLSTPATGLTIAQEIGRALLWGMLAGLSAAGLYNVGGRQIFASLASPAKSAPPALKFGRRPSSPAKLARRLKLANYLPKALPEIPTIVDWRDKMGTLNMWANDRYGICVFAAIANCIQLWCSQSGKAFTLTLADVIAAYSQCTGFDPSQTRADGSNPTDNGTSLLEALSFMQKTGMGGYKIGPYVAIDPNNSDHVRATTYLYGAMLFGINVPKSAIKQFDAHVSWTMKNARRFGGTASQGGHGVMEAADVNGELQTATWARWQPTEPDFMTANCDEAYAIFSPDWVDKLGSNPLQMKSDQLLADLSALQR